MNPIIPTPLLLLGTTAIVCAGPYAPAAGIPGSTAIHRTDSRFTTWANRVDSYQPGGSLSDSWKDTAQALGPATDDPAHVTGLGSGGSITLTFPGFIRDGPGADFAVFENSFSDTFIEHAWVEISRDGVNFTRFPNFSLTANPVGAFGRIDPTEVRGLAGKYRQPFGEPFDLAEVGLDQISHVRLVDVVGDGTARDSDNRIIYDPWPVTGSAGFDLEAVGVIHLQQWQTLTVGALHGDGVNATAFAHLPDGRFVLGAQGILSVQNAWGTAGRSPIGNGGVEFDPAFIAIADGNEALLGTGGGFGNAGGLHRFDPGRPAVPVRNLPLAVFPNFSGVWWRSPVTGRAGWILGGPAGPAQRHSLTYLSADGAVRGVVVSDLSTYSAAVTADGAGNVFAAQYELPGSPQEAESEWVRKFTVAQMDAAVDALAAGQPVLSGSAGTKVFQFDSAGSLAVDALGRFWASGFKVNHLQLFDPATGASRRLVPDHAPLAGVTDVLYQVQTFSRHGGAYAAFMATGESGTPGAPILHGLAPLSAVTVPETLASWQSFHFGAANLTPGQEAVLWGAAADPDRDGLPNLLEYALNTLPREPASDVLKPGFSAGRLTLTFPRNPLRTDLEYLVEGAAQLEGSWTVLAHSAQGGPTAGVSPANPAIEEIASGSIIFVTVRDIVATTTANHRFLRLRISLRP